MQRNPCGDIKFNKQHIVTDMTINTFLTAYSSFDWLHKYKSSLKLNIFNI